MFLLQLDGLSDCIPHTELPGTSKLFADLLYNYARVAKFYGHDPSQPSSFDAAAKQIQYPAERRAAMVKALAGQNAPSELLTRFAQPGTVAVVTGQQVGLFGGPAYTIYKALTAAKLAKNLTERGISAVPIFWMATEDHDFAEVNHTWVFDGEGHPSRVGVESDITGQKPAGNYPVLQPPIDALRAAMSGFEHTDAVIAAVKDAYPPGATMGAGFRALVLKLLERVGVLVLDPLDPAIRAIGAPFLAEAVKAAPELKAALLARGKELAAAGYHSQVLVEEKTSLFFLLDKGERKTLRLKDSECATLADRAADVSPNALLRPVWQDFMLPTIAYVGGPGELAYFAQSAVLYDKLLGRMPVMLPRACFTLLDARAEKLMKKFGLKLADVMVKRDELRARIAKQLLPSGLGAEFEMTSAQTLAGLDKLAASLQEFDPTLAAAMAKSRAKVLYQIEKLRRKTERETLRRDARATADAAYLTGLLYPEDHLQERLHSILPFLAKYGMDLVDRLYDEVKPECPDHRVLTL
ncbi:MAG: bacillithiol biosynthesis cysteine-adding enzyme BshC [Bryobacteraceae bacterium]